MLITKSNTLTTLSLVIGLFAANAFAGRANIHCVESGFVAEDLGKHYDVEVDFDEGEYLPHPRGAITGFLMTGTLVKRHYECHSNMPVQVVDLMEVRTASCGNGSRVTRIEATPAGLHAVNDPDGSICGRRP